MEPNYWPTESKRGVGRVERDKCEVCGEERIGVIMRPNGKLLCSDHNRDRMREMTPTGLTRNDERIARELYQYYLNCGLHPDHALEKLAFNLAMEPPMFTRLVPLLDELRGKYCV